ncbi:MAG: hypothetical protein DI529_17945, partial [Chryseobacterium sp.]
MERDKKQAEVKVYDGFCLVDRYNDYKNYKIGLAELFRDDYWFDNNFELAKPGDIISIERLDFSDSTKFYQQKNYTFTIGKSYIDFSDPATYPDPDIITLTNNLLNSYSGKFYTKNIEAISQIDSASRIEFTKLLTFICFRAEHIVDNTLIIFTMRDNNNTDKNLETIKQAVREKYINNNSGLYNKLPKIDQIIGELMKDWGYVDGVDATFMFDGKSIDFIRNYYNAISSFYITLLEADEIVYFKYDDHGNPKNFQGINLTHDGELDSNGNVIHVSQDEKDKKDSERRVAYLFKYLTTEGLGIFDFEQRMSWLKDLVGQVKLEQQNANSATQNNFIKLLNTFVNKDEADSLLDYLLENNGVQTNFEIVYNKLDDGRLERYPVISWFVEQATNRMYFIYSLYNAWRFSKYNINYIPQGQTANEDGVNPNSYFLNAGKKYYPKFDSQGNLKSGSNPILAFSVSKVEDNGNYYVQVISSGISYKPKKELQKEIITINEVQTTNINTYNPYAAGGTPSYYGTEKKYGDYHLYQPISLLGYQADLDLEIPNLTPIPAFLFYYAVDYDTLKDFDAAINFAIQITTDIALFYFTGGVSTLKHLSYLKYIYNFRKGMVATDAVLVWRGIDAAAETVAVTSGVLTAYFDYEATVNNDPRLKDLYKKLSMFFLALTLGTGGGAVYARTKTVKAADEVLAEINRLTNVGISHDLPNDILSVLYTVRNISTVSKTFFQNRISSLVVNDLGESNHIYNFYEALDNIEKNNFWMHFKNYVGDSSQSSTNWGQTDLLFWKTINKTEDEQSALRLVIWRDVTDDAFGKTLRSDLNYLNEFVIFRYNYNGANWVHINDMIFTDGTRYIGGHTSKNLIKASGLEVSSGSFNGKWIEIDHIPTTGTNQNINSVSDFITHPKGHIKYKKGELYYRYSGLEGIRAESYVLNGKLVKKIQTEKTIINPAWSDERKIQEHIFALHHKKLIFTEKKGLLHGRAYPQVQKTYASSFSDGTSIKIKWKN